MGDRGADAHRVGHVHRNDMGVAALTLDLRAQVLEAFDAAGAQDDGGTCAGQHTGCLRAQPAGGAGDEGHTAGEVNGIGHLLGS